MEVPEVETEPTRRRPGVGRLDEEKLVDVCLVEVLPDSK